MDNSSRSINGRQKIAGVRLVYGNPPALSTDPLETMDYCTRLVMQLKEDELLHGKELSYMTEMLEMEELGFAYVDSDEE